MPRLRRIEEAGVLREPAPATRSGVRSQESGVRGPESRVSRPLTPDPVPHCRSHERRMRAAAVISLIVAFAGPAHADGAFPDSLTLLLPPDHGQEVSFSSNFGLVTSPDFGGTWTYACEPAMGACTTMCYAFLYQMGPPPQNRIYVESIAGLEYS